MKSLDRRQFLSRSGKAVLSAGIGLMIPGGKSSKILGANERLQVAIIGCGGRGMGVLKLMIDEGAVVPYVCDIHPERVGNAAKEIGEKQGRIPRKANSMQEVLDSRDVDAVLISTPDHWHGPASIMACQAGKDVYVEKPHAHNIRESKLMLKAARKYKCVLQVGTQNRSGPYNHKALDYIQQGRIGNIRLVKVFNLKPGSEFRLGPAGTKPDGFNWDAWLGPAESRPYHQRIFRGGWHHFWDFSGGDLADDGIHQLDLAMMLMNQKKAPKAVSCSGGRMQYKGDDSEVPDLQIVTFDFDDFVMTFEHSNYPRYMRKTTGTIRRNDEFPYWTQNSTRIELYGSELLMILGRHGGGWITMTSGGKIVDKVYGRPADVPHVQNFLECIKSRKLPNADIGILHPSCTMLHQANIAHRLGNLKLKYDGDKDLFIDNENANKLIARKYRKEYEVTDNI